jgi:hypothetical protein
LPRSIRASRRSTRRQAPRRRVLALCALYLELVSATPYFVRLMARGLVTQADVAERFTALFELAVDGLALDKKPACAGAMRSSISRMLCAGRQAGTRRGGTPRFLILAGMQASVEASA